MQQHLVVLASGHPCRAHLFPARPIDGAGPARAEVHRRGRFAGGLRALVGTPGPVDLAAAVGVQVTGPESAAEEVGCPGEQTDDGEAEGKGVGALPGEPGQARGMQ